MLVPETTGQTVDETRHSTNARSVDWTQALRIQTGWTSELKATATHEPFRDLRNTADISKPKCHLAVIASCEGEAVLLTTWCMAHRTEIESLLAVLVHSISWLAADIAPVGNLVCGQLQAVAVEADVWVIISTETRLTHCSVTAALCETVAASGAHTWSLMIDRQKENLTQLSLAKRKVRRVARSSGFMPHPGGLFRMCIPGDLLGDTEVTGSR